MSYQHLTQEERYHIATFRRLGKSASEIARLLERHKSTISRELRRNCPLKHYRAERAHGCYRERLGHKGHRRHHWYALFEPIVVPLLSIGWSPQQISAYVADKGYVPVSHQWLYRRLHEERAAGGELYKLLRHPKRYRTGKAQGSYRGSIAGRVSIKERPGEVDTRERQGDWEADTVIGSKQRGALVTLVERQSGYACVRRVNRCDAHSVSEAIQKALKPIRKQVLTLTFDNGTEFADHQQVGKKLKAACYFADPHSPWQRGCNENFNGLLRQYFPKKGTDFTKVSDAQVAYVQRLLNNRPRKRLGWRTPAQVFEGKSTIDLPVQVLHLLCESTPSKISFHLSSR